VLQIGRSLVRSQLMSVGIFIDIKSFRSHYGPGVDSASNRNEYQEYFLGVKGGRCVRLTPLPPSCAVDTKSVKRNFLEPSGTVQAYFGTDLPFTHLNSVHGYRPNKYKTHYFALGHLKYNATSQKPFKISQFEERNQAFVGCT
jgi:hypothetical protein